MPQHRNDGSNIGIASGTWNEEVEATNLTLPKLEVGMRWAEIVEDEIVYSQQVTPTIGGAGVWILPQAGLGTVAGFQPAYNENLLLSSYEEVEYVVAVDRFLRGAGGGTVQPGGTNPSFSIKEHGEPGIPAGLSWVARQLFLGPNPGATADVWIVGFDGRGKLIEEKLPLVGALSVYTYVSVLGFRIVTPVPGDSWQIDLANGVGLHYPIAGDEEAIVVQGVVAQAIASPFVNDGLITGPVAGTATPPVPNGEPRGIWQPPLGSSIFVKRARLYYLASRVDSREA